MLQLLDLAGIYFRAFFAVPGSTKAPDGRPNNAIRGSLDIIRRVVEDCGPDRVVACLDLDWRPAFRVAAIPSYKTHRVLVSAPPVRGVMQEVVPDELSPQVPVLLEVLSSIGIALAGAEGYEADDVIGTLATAAGPGDRVAIVTGDRDLFQLVRDPVVQVLFPRRGTSDMARMDEAGVRAKCGVPPSRYVDFAILRGDPSDGLPGVAGVGEKTAARLVDEYPSLDALVAARDRLPPRVAAALADAGDYLDAMRVVVPVATKLDVELTAPAEPDPERLQELAERHRLSGPVRRLLQAMRDAGLSTVDPPAAE
jgi:5'-3' exonuclease